MIISTCLVKPVKKIRFQMDFTGLPVTDLKTYTHDNYKSVLYSSAIPEYFLGEHQKKKPTKHRLEKKTKECLRFLHQLNEDKSKQAFQYDNNFHETNKKKCIPWRNP